MTTRLWILAIAWMAVALSPAGVAWAEDNPESLAAPRPVIVQQAPAGVSKVELDANISQLKSEVRAQRDLTELRVNVLENEIRQSSAYVERLLFAFMLAIGIVVFVVLITINKQTGINNEKMRSLIQRGDRSIEEFNRMMDRPETDYFHVATKLGRIMNRLRENEHVTLAQKEIGDIYAAAQDPTLPVTLHLQANALKQEHAGDYRSAIIIWERLLEVDSSNPEVLLHLAKDYKRLAESGGDHRAGEYRKASLEYFQQYAVRTSNLFSAVLEMQQKSDGAAVTRLPAPLQPDAPLPSPPGPVVAPPPPPVIKPVLKQPSKAVIKRPAVTSTTVAAATPAVPAPTTAPEPKPTTEPKGEPAGQPAVAPAGAPPPADPPQVVTPTVAEPPAPAPVVAPPPAVVPPAKPATPVPAARASTGNGADIDNPKDDGADTAPSGAAPLPVPPAPPQPVPVLKQQVQSPKTNGADAQPAAQPASGAVSRKAGKKRLAVPKMKGKASTTPPAKAEQQLSDKDRSLAFASRLEKANDFFRRYVSAKPSEKLKWLNAAESELEIAETYDKSEQLYLLWGGTVIEKVRLGKGDRNVVANQALDIFSRGQEVADGAFHNQIALCYALIGDESRCRDAMQDAVASGRLDPTIYADEPEFAGYRQQQWYQEMLATAG